MFLLQVYCEYFVCYYTLNSVNHTKARIFIVDDSSFCRDQLKRNYNLRQYWLQVDVNDLSSFDPILADKLLKVPSDYLPLVHPFYIDMKSLHDSSYFSLKRLQAKQLMS